MDASTGPHGCGACWQANVDTEGIDEASLMCRMCEAGTDVVDVVVVSPDPNVDAEAAHEPVRVARV